MAKCNLSSGGVRSNLRAAVDIPADRLWKYSTTVNEVTLCGSGEEADGLCITDTLQDEILNADGGSNYSRKETGVFDEITNDGTLTVGAEWMCGASGVITAYVAAGDNRPLGKVLRVYDDEVVGEVTIHTAEVTFYSK